MLTLASTIILSFVNVAYSTVGYTCEYGPEEGAVSIVTQLYYVKHSMLAQTPAGNTIYNGLESSTIWDI